MFVQEISWPRGYRNAFRLALAALLALEALGVTALGPGRGWAPLAVSLAVGVMVFVLVELFMNLRVTVDERQVVVAFGPFKERIPLSDIRACEPTHYTFRDFGGWGIRVRWGRRMYNVPGDGGRAVKLELASGKQLFFSSADPAAACRAIADARGTV